MIVQALRSGALALGLISSSAMAAPYSNIYVFGDSLLDTGNIAANPVTNTPGLRFTNFEGTIGIEFVADGLGVARPTPSALGGTNYAVGGNVAADVLASIGVAGNASYDRDVGAPFGTLTFNSFFADLQASGASLDQNALYVLDGGGNDILPIGTAATAAGTAAATAIIVGGGDAAAAAAAAAAAGEATVRAEASAAANLILTGAGALAAQGAQNIVIYNVPNFGLGPAGNAAGSANTSTIAGAVNTFLNFGASSVNANIILLDSFSLLGEIVATPAEFGFSSLDSTTIQTTCYEGVGDAGCTQNANSSTGVLPNAAEILYNDGLHPTEAGQKILADYLLSVVNGAAQLSALPALGTNDVKTTWQAVAPSLRANRWQNAVAVGNSSLIATLQNRDQDLTGSFGDINIESDQQVVGLNHRFSDAFHAGFTLSTGDNDLNTGGLKANLDSFNITAFGGYRAETWFMDTMITLADQDYDIDRAFTLGVATRNASATTEGYSTAVSVLLGKSLTGDSLRVGPVIGFDYIGNKVDAFKEREGLATSLFAESQTYNTEALKAGVFLNAAIDFCRCTIGGEAIYYSEQNDGAYSATVGLVTIGNNSFTVPSIERDDSRIAIDLSLNAALTDNFLLNVSLGSEDADNSDATQFGLGLQYSF